MTDVAPRSREALEALNQRLRAAADVLLDEVPPVDPDLAQDTGALLSALVEVARTSLRADHAWLLSTVASGVLPLPDQVEDLRRAFELSTSPAEAEIALLRRARAALCANPEAGERRTVVVSDAVVVDVSFSAQNDKHTGIQRVTREVCPRWEAGHDITLVAWCDGERALRTLRADEAARVLEWPADSTLPRPPRRAATDEEPVTVIPWRSTVVLPEVAQGTTALPLAALAQYSGNEVAAIGYDAIPVVSADLRPVPEPDRFVGYLTVIKHASRVAGISASATAEFRGFAEAVRAQGLPGPDVVEVQLAADAPKGGHLTATPDAADPEAERPRVLCVGSHELHKNHLAVLHAAELLWREGLDFELVFMGGPGWDTSGYDARVADLAAAGRPVQSLSSVTDVELGRLYRSARFTVFPSLHEGYGLPVAESLACGTPVVTTNYGSTAEIAERGGCVLVDPRDDDDLAAAIRSLLTDDERYARLKAEAVAFTPRTWDEYADELWKALVAR
jgi:glycosyltransferase involved in cell wall biosynthesis